MLEEKVTDFVREDGILKKLVISKNIKKDYIRSFSANKTVYEEFQKTCMNEHRQISDVLLECMLKYIMEHRDSHNPQSMISQFSDESVIAIPSLLASTETWNKFYDAINGPIYLQVGQELNHKMYLHKQMRSKF